MKTLDELMPRYEFSERHSIPVEAPPERAERALREVTLADVPLVRALFALRGLPRRGRVLDVVAALGRVLDDVPGEGIVLGVRGQLWRARGGDDGGAAARRSRTFARDRRGSRPRRGYTWRIRSRGASSGATGSLSGRSAA
jgi:hypothetical protein